MNLEGQSFGLLTVLRRAEPRREHARWLCRCTCGKEIEVQQTNLRSGASKTCGCSRKAFKGCGHPRWKGGLPPDPAKRRQNAKNSARRHPEKVNARAAVKRAVRAGRIPPIYELKCIDCGEQAERYDHARGYNEPLDVEPVCFRCDGIRIRERGECRQENRRNLEAAP